MDIELVHALKSLGVFNGQLQLLLQFMVATIWWEINAIETAYRERKTKSKGKGTGTSNRI